MASAERGEGSSGSSDCWGRGTKWLVQRGERGVVAPVTAGEEVLSG